MGSQHAEKYKFFDLLVRDRCLTALDIAVAWRLLDRVNEVTGTAWPSAVRLADELGCARRTVFESTAHLKAQGWFRKRKGGGRGRTTHYEPCLERVNASSLFRNKTEPETVSHSALNGEPGRNKTVSQRSPESSHESSQESSHDAHTRAQGCALGTQGKNTDGTTQPNPPGAGTTSTAVESARQENMLLSIPGGKSGSSSQRWQKWVIDMTNSDRDQDETHKKLDKLLADVVLEQRITVEEASSWVWDRFQEAEGSMAVGTCPWAQVDLERARWRLADRQRA